MQSARLDYWYIRHQQLHGIVYGHPMLEDGTEIATSFIITINFECKTVATANTIYSLGTVHSRYYQYCSDISELIMTERLLGDHHWQGLS